MAGDHGERGGQAAMGDGDARCRWYPDGGSDAGDDVERNSCGLEGVGLLAAATEHVRVSALQADDLEALTAEVDEKRVDDVLRGRPARTLADVDELGPRSCQFEDGRIGQPVVDDDVS